MRVRITHPRMDFFYMDHPALKGRFQSGDEHELPDGFDLAEFGGLGLRAKAVDPANTPTPAKKKRKKRGRPRKS